MKYPRCYYTLDSLHYSKEINIDLNYKILNNLNENDYIELIIFDFDYNKDFNIDLYGENKYFKVEY